MFWIGAAVTTNGDVTIIYPTGQRVSGAEATRAPIPLGARVVTGPSGRFQVRLIDETSFTIGASSEMIMDRFVFDPDNRPTRVGLKIVKGAFRWVTGHLRNTALDATITTPMGGLGIRGTDLEIQIDPSGSGLITLHEGEVDFEVYDSGRALVMHAGQKLRWENFGDPHLE